MSKNNALKREAKRQAGSAVKTSDVVEYEFRKNKLEAKNFSQELFITSLRHSDVSIGSGAAGTGKTYLASRVAAELYLNNGSIHNIILTRPNVEAGEKLGFLPGELEEKYAPYLQPFEKGLMDGLGSKFKADMNKKIFPQPLGYMRGKTFDNSIIMLDEAQNTTIPTMKMFLTRVGTNSRVFITGDSDQSDLPPNKTNGLEWLIREVRRQNVPVDIIDFGSKDCVRSNTCKMMLEMIDKSE